MYLHMFYRGTSCVHRMRYQRTPGGATTKGQRFEYNTAALLYFRCLQRAYKFQLGCNLAGFGKFDDVFLKLRLKNEDKPQVVLLQLKHKGKGGHVRLDQLLARSGDFSLLQYFRSFCEIQNHCERPGDPINSHIYSELDFEECTFVLFTNCAVEHRSRSLPQLSELENMLSTEAENADIFSFGPEEREVWDLREGHDDCDRYRSFLKRLRVYSGQSHVDTLSKLVREEVRTCGALNASDSDDLYSKFIRSMETWWNDDDTFLTERSPHWSLILMQYLNRNMDRKLEKVEYKFKSNSVGYLDETTRDSFINVVIPDVKESTRCLKLFGLLRTHFPGRYLLMSEEDALRARNQVVSVCGNEVCEVLVVDTRSCSAFLEHEADLGPHLCITVLLSRDKLNPGRNKCRYVEDRWTFDQLSANSQWQMLRNPVLFQGKRVPLRMVCGSVVSGEVVSTLLSGKPVRIGRPLPAMGDLYIPRTLCHQAVLREAVLTTTHTDDVFAVSGDMLQVDMSEVDPDSVECGEGIIHLSYTESGLYSSTGHSDKLKFDDLCKKYKRVKNVHWLQLMDGFVLWKESCGSESTPRQFVERMSRNCGGGAVCCHEAERLADWRDKLVLVMGEPGMGKSTLLLSVAQEMKNKEPGSWVVHVVLPEYTSVLHKVAARDIDWKHVEDILTKAVSDQRSTDLELERNLLRDSLQRRGNIFVLLDAVDEVSPVYTGHVLAIERTLLGSKVSCIWVTSRQVLQEDLQRELKALPLVLAPFSDEQQKVFMRKYLFQYSTDCSVDSNLLKEQLDDLLDLTSTSGSVIGRHPCDVPLHAMMVASTLIQSTPIYENLHEALTVSSMYTRFVDKKREHFYKKREEDLTKLQLTPREEIERELFIDIHMKCSLAVVFTEEELLAYNIPNYKEDIELFLNDVTRERTGIIDGLEDNIPRFVHFRFAEYFAARWLVNEFLSRRAQIDQQGIQARFETIRRRIVNAVSRQFRCKSGRHNKIMYELLLQKKYEFLRRVFDEMLAAGFKLHEAVLTGDCDLVKRLLQSGAAVDCVDRGGRLALHLAAAYGRSDVVKEILSSGSPVSTLDEVLGWSSLRYADRYEFWDVAELLLQNRANDNDLMVLRSRVRQLQEAELFVSDDSVGLLEMVKLLQRLGSGVNNKKLRNCIPLYVAAALGSTEVVNSLLADNADINKTDKHGRTPLFAAAARGYTEVVNVLLAHNADVNKADISGWTPLNAVATYSSIELVNMLLAHGASINKTDIAGHTPLHTAAACGFIEIVNVLITHDAKINKAASNGFTPLHAAALSGCYNLRNVLLNRGILNSSSPLFGESRHLDIVRFFLARGADVNVASIGGDTALTCAALSGKIEVVRLLLEHGADVNRCNRKNNTALHIAASRGHLDAIRVLLEARADVSLANTYGNTALDIARARGLSAIEKLLLTAS